MLHPLSEVHPHYKNVTFLWQYKSNSLRDPCVAPLLALIAFAPLISIGFGFGLRPSPFAQDDALKVMQCEQNHYPFGKLSSMSVLGGGTKTLAGAIARYSAGNEKV